MAARWLTFLLLICAISMATVAARASDDTDDDDDGDDDDAALYDATVSGDFTGTGKVELSGTTVTFTITIKNKAGTTGQLKVVNLPLKNNRFSGTGTVMGVPMRIAGRVDHANLKGENKPRRLMATFGTVAGATGRVIAYKKSNGLNDDDDDGVDDDCND